MNNIEFNENKDPLMHVDSQQDANKLYKAQPWWLVFQVLITLVGSGYSIYALIMSIKEENYFGISFATLLMITIIFSLALKIVRVNIGKEEIVFTYFFYRKKIIKINDIDEIELIMKRGQVCILKAKRAKIAFQLISIQDADQVIKTVITRAPLVFVKGSRLGATYFRK